MADTFKQKLLMIHLRKKRLSKTHLVIPDQHASPDGCSDRATWLGKLIVDIKPDVVVNIGDAIDLDSLCSFDWGKRNFYSKSYKKDIDSHLEFQHRLWAEVRKTKKKLPYRVFFEGNHERRIERALQTLPTGTLSFEDLELNEYYDEVVRYSGWDVPGTKSIDGVLYAHYFVSGIKGNAISSEHMANALVAKNLVSSTCGHTHMLDFSIKTSASGQKIMGCTVGCYQDYSPAWAGEDITKLWDKGVLIKRNVGDGTYDPQWISLSAIKREYAS